MSIAEQIRKALQDEYNEGGKQQEMAARHRVSQQYISRLLSGKRSCDGLTLKAVSSMFPRATIHLNGDTIHAENSGVNNGVMGINHGMVSPAASASAAEFRQKAIDAVISLNIPAEASITVLKTLKELK